MLFVDQVDLRQYKSIINDLRQYQSIIDDLGQYQSIMTWEESRTQFLLIQSMTLEFTQHVTGSQV